jgi:hypothetical protein
MNRLAGTPSTRVVRHQPRTTGGVLRTGTRYLRWPTGDLCTVTTQRGRWGPAGLEVRGGIGAAPAQRNRIRS